MDNSPARYTLRPAVHDRLCPMALAAAGGLPEISERGSLPSSITPSNFTTDSMAEQRLHTDDSFPAMTPGQRLYFEVNGYVVIENTLAAAECEELLDALEELRARFEAEENPAEAVIDGALAETWKPPHYFCWGHLLQAHPAFCRYLTHPRLVALVEEVVGGKVRLDESAAIVNRRLPGFDPGPGSATSGIAAASPASTATPTAASTTAPSSRP